LVVSSAAIWIFPRGAEFPIFEGLARFVNFSGARAQVFASSATRFRNFVRLQLHRRYPDSTADRQPVALVLP
jgi:hypothetical protein